MSNCYTYTQQRKKITRHESLISAIESLTTNREKTCCVERNYVRRVYDYFALSEDDSENKNEALKIQPKYISSWEKLHDSCVGTKRPEDLVVCYLCGPEPNNDFNELVSLGILPQNIWAFETNAEIYRSAVSSYGIGEFPQPRILKQNIETFFQQTPKKFDVIYIDACGSIPSQQHALRCISTICLNHRLTSPGVIISNFAIPDKTDSSIQEYYKCISMYLFFKEYPNEDIEINDSGIINDSYINLMEKVRLDFEMYYGKFVSAILRDIPSVIIPIQRIAKNPYIGQLFNNIDFSQENNINLVNSIKNNSLAKYFFTVDLLKQKLLLDNRTILLYKELGNIDDLLNGMMLVLHLKDDRLILKDDVADIKEYFDVGRNIYQFLDKPHSNLFFDTILNQLSYPMHCNISQSKSFTYTAKSMAMYTDVTILDECRYIYEWLPAIHQIQSAFENTSWQYIFRFALDGLVKMRQEYNNEFFFQGAVISSTEDGFEKHICSKRELIY